SKYSENGLRVLAFAYHPHPVKLHNGDTPRLPQWTLLGLVTFTDELRPHLKHTLEQFIQNGINIKVISGDNPQTVAALARQAGLPGDLSFVSEPELTGMSEAEFRPAAVENTIFGRITPDQNEALADALRAQGHYVAMIGDGVNDVLSLKKADMGIAMESGSSATRSVADMVLLGDSFEALPSAFTEGQRIINGMKDVLRLFMTRVLYSALLIIGISVIDLGFPIEPKHNLLIVFLSVSVPTLTLALWSRLASVPSAVCCGKSLILLFRLLCLSLFLACSFMSWPSPLLRWILSTCRLRMSRPIPPMLGSTMTSQDPIISPLRWRPCSHNLRSRPF